MNKIARRTLTVPYTYTKGKDKVITFNLPHTKRTTKVITLTVPVSTDTPVHRVIHINVVAEKSSNKRTAKSFTKPVTTKKKQED